MKINVFKYLSDIQYNEETICMQGRLHNIIENSKTMEILKKCLTRTNKHKSVAKS